MTAKSPLAESLERGIIIAALGIGIGRDEDGTVHVAPLSPEVPPEHMDAIAERVLQAILSMLVQPAPRPGEQNGTRTEHEMPR